MDKQFHPSLYWACDYFSLLGFKLNLVNKRGPDNVMLDYLRCSRKQTEQYLRSNHCLGIFITWRLLRASLVHEHPLYFVRVCLYISSTGVNVNSATCQYRERIWIARRFFLLSERAFSIKSLAQICCDNYTSDVILYSLFHVLQVIH